MKRRRWLFAAAALLTVPLLTSFSFAQQEKAQVGDEEMFAVGAMRTINTAEITYASAYNTGFSKTLADLGMGPGWKEPSPKAAGLIDEELTTGKKGGYAFTYKPGKPGDKGMILTYEVTARPDKSKKGLKSFYSDQTGRIRWTAKNRAAKADDPEIGKEFLGE